MKTIKTQTIYIGGMTCPSCKTRIEEKLKSIEGVVNAEIDLNSGKSFITWNPQAIEFDSITTAIEKLGYTVSERGIKTPISQILGTGVIILALYIMLQHFGILTMTAGFPLAESGTAYGMLFIIGLITSIHCIAMCGGINLSQCLPNPTPESKSKTVLLPAILYNVGRVVSYTFIGGIVGAIGSAVTVSGRFQGILQLVAGAFMILMGINMLGYFPVLRRFSLNIPSVFAKKIASEKNSSSNPLYIGLLNGLMPCGPLQAMQIYALSTGNPLAGAISMFLFSMGTVPLMFGLGAISSLLSRRFTAPIIKGGAILVTVMGLIMCTYSFGLFGFNIPFLDNSPVITRRSVNNTNTASVIKNGFQQVDSALTPGRYPAITVRQGIPVQWKINASANSINGCNNRMIIREYGIEHRFTPGENIIEFTPDKIGRFSYSCWMGMIRSSITVVDANADIIQDETAPTAPQPAGVKISTDKVAIARMDAGFQEIAVTLTDDGFEPSIIIVQNNIPARWIIENNSLDPGNAGLIVPAYYTRIPIEQGNNTIQFRPVGDFDFSTIDNIFYGYVKVVDDLKTVNIDEVKQEAADFETLIYPDAYFDDQSQGGSCCQ